MDFRCAKNKDIESFLHNKALMFQKQQLCSVYLLCDKVAFSKGIISIQAYFTLSHKAIIIPTTNIEVSKSKRDAIMKNRKAELFEFVLIGQLGKRIEQNEDGSFTYTSVKGVEILGAAREIINAASDLIACRAVLVECDDTEKLKSFYQENGFKFLQKDIYNQYYYIL